MTASPLIKYFIKSNLQFRVSTVAKSVTNVYLMNKNGLISP